MLDMKLTDMPELRLIDGDTGNIVKISGLDQLKKLRRLLNEYIELTEEKYQ